MSDTTTCSNCGTEVPSAASFCTGCGQPLSAAAAPPPPPPPADPAPAEDVTRVETPGLNDATQVTPPPPSTPAPSPYAAPAPPPPAAAPSGPWGPSSSEPPTAAPWSPPTESSAPSTPAAPPAPAWQQPTPPPPPPSPGGYPPAGGTDWQAPGAAAAAAPWGTGAPVDAPEKQATGGSVFGGLVGLIGAVLAIVGVFSGWVKLGSTGTVTAWSLTAGDGLLKTQTPYVIVILAAASVIVSLVLFTGIARTLARITAVLLGIAIIGVTAANWNEIASFVTDNFPSSFKATTAIGFYFTIVGGVLVIASALMPAKKK